jgi:hypothetical protein
MDEPEDRPFNPSIMLNALAMPVIAKHVKKSETIGINSQSSIKKTPIE